MVASTNLDNFDLKSTISSFASKLRSTNEHGKLLRALLVFEDLAVQFILRTFFVEMKWPYAVGSTFTTWQFMDQLRVHRTQRGITSTFLRRIAQYGILKEGSTSSTTWQVLQDPPKASDISSRIKNLQTQLLEFPECAIEGRFLTHVGGNLSDVLRGRRTGLDVLFPPENSMEFEYGATAFYTTSNLMANTKIVYIVQGILATIRHKLATTPKDEKLKLHILEIGAGTGSTTRLVLDAIYTQLDATNLELSYTFTDITSFFLEKAHSKFPMLFPAVKFEFKMLDIEIPPEPNTATYDMVLAADVFHATEDLDDTLSNTRAYMKPGALLVIAEVFQSTTPMECSFGITEGWWRFGDERLHQGKNTPLLNEGEWEILLANFNYNNIFSVVDGANGVVFANAAA